MTILHNVLKEHYSDYYGKSNYRLVAVVDFSHIMKVAVDKNLVDDDLKEYNSMWVPSSLKEAIKYRDKISFAGHYVSLFRKLFPAMSFYGGKNKHKLLDAYLLYSPMLDDNLEWSKKGTKYESFGGKCKKFPVATNKKHICDFIEKYGDFFPNTCYNTQEEAEKYINDKIDYLNRLCEKIPT